MDLGAVGVTVFDLGAGATGAGTISVCGSKMSFLGFLGLRAKDLSKVTLRAAKSMPLTT